MTGFYLAQVVFVLLPIVGFVCLVYGLYRNQNFTRRTIYAYLFVFFASFSTLPQIYWVYEFLAQSTGIANISWFLCYLMVSFGLYFLFLALEDAMTLAKYTPVVRVIFVLSVSVMLVVFPQFAYIYNIDHTNPTNLFEVIFMISFYTYAGILSLIYLQASFKSLSTETEFHAKLRWFTIIFSAISGITFFFGRNLYFLGLTVWEPESTIMTVWANTNTFALMCTFSWAFFFIPTSNYQQILTPFLYIKNVQNLRYLVELQNLTSTWHSPVVPHFIDIDWESRLLDVDLNIHRLIRVVIDSKVHLMQSKRQGAFHLMPDMAHALYKPLLSVDDSDYHQSVLGYVAVAQSQIHLPFSFWVLPNTWRSILSFDIEQIAKWVSRILHPFIIPVISLFLIMYLSGTPVVDALIWMLIFLVVAISPIFFYVLINYKIGRFTTMDVSIRENRRGLYPVAIFSFIVLWGVIVAFDAPQMVTLSLYALLLGVGIAAVVNATYTKISLHSIMISGCSYILLVLSWPVGVMMVLGTVLVGWSRVYLKEHTLEQVLLGWIASLVSVTLVFGQLFMTYF